MNLTATFTGEHATTKSVKRSLNNCDHVSNMYIWAILAGKPTILTCRPSTQARRARVSLICQAQRLVLKPTGDGDASHIDPSSPLSAASLLELKEGSIYELGRQEPADLIVPVPTVSARHALVRVEEDGSVTVTDLGSTNGTIIDGQELKPNASVSG